MNKLYLIYIKVGMSGKLLLDSPAQSFLDSGPMRAHDHNFVLSKVFTFFFQMGLLFDEKERGSGCDWSLPSTGGDSSRHLLTNRPFPPHRHTRTHKHSLLTHSVQKCFVSCCRSTREHPMILCNLPNTVAKTYCRNCCYSDMQVLRQNFFYITGIHTDNRFPN
jgi:hypothetical protein